MELASRTAPADSVTEQVVEAVADAEGVEPVDLSPPLYEVVDPDALEDLFAKPREGAAVELTFEYRGHEVTVAGPDQVSIVD